jgi:hypothetical protein
VTSQYSHVEWRKLLAEYTSQHCIFIKHHKLDALETTRIGFLAKKHAPPGILTEKFMLASHNPSPFANLFVTNQRILINFIMPWTLTMEDPMESP